MKKKHKTLLRYVIPTIIGLSIVTYALNSRDAWVHVYKPKGDHAPKVVTGVPAEESSTESP